MLKHFAIVGIRNFLKHRVSSFINVFSLSLSVGCALFVFVFVEFFYNQGTSHENSEDIYIINREILINGKSEVHSGTPEPLALALKSDLPEVVKATRIRDIPGHVRFGSRVFKEQIRFADEDFMEIFSFPIKWGSPLALQDPNSIIISEEAARKIAEKESPVGKTIQIKFLGSGTEHMESFTIGAVLHTIDKKAGFDFDFLISYQKQPLSQERLSNWAEYNNATFVLLKEEKDLEKIAGTSQKFVEIQRAADKDFPIQNLIFQVLQTASHSASDVRGNILSSAALEAYIVLIALAVLTMVLSCINYINIAIASASMRLKEIAVRKSIGGIRSQLIAQFFAENLIVCLVSIIAGVMWVELLFLPGFKSLISNPLTIDYLNPNLWMFFLVLVVLLSIGGGAYPAFFITKFETTAIFRNSSLRAGKGLFRKVLLTIQYFFSFVTISSAIVLFQNDSFHRKLGWGYDQHDKVVVHLAGSNYEQLKNKLSSLPIVEKIAGSTNQVGASSEELAIKINGETRSFDHLRVGADYLPTLGIRTSLGRDFNEGTSEVTSAILVNERFVQEMDWERPIGKSIEVKNQNYYVTGVVSNFHFKPFSEEIEPLIISVAEPKDFRYLTLNLSQSPERSDIALMENIWKELNPDDPFEYSYQEDVFQSSFLQYNILAKVLATAGLIAILLAIFGLFGLSAIRVRSRLKEVSIRKVLGGDEKHLFYILNKEYISLLLFSIVLALPAAHLAMTTLLGIATKYPIPITYIPFILTGLLVVGLSILAVGFHIAKAIKSNPAITLRTE